MPIYLPAGDGYRALDQYLLDTGAEQIFLVCGRSLDRLALGRYFDTLEDRLNIRTVRFQGFTPNPRYEDAAVGAERFRAADCGLIAAVGGGSAMDVAKCIKLFAPLDPARPYLEQTLKPAPIPLLAIPTTAGTGSEATHFAVIYHQGRKLSVAHPDALPNAVLLDPSALEALPLYQRKATALDALCHAVESFWSRQASAESRDLARRAMALLLSYLESYLRNTPEGNAGMLQAANLAGQAINLTTTTAGHALSYGLTSLYGLAHGHAAALCVESLWPYMLAHISRAPRPAALAETFQALGEALDCAGPEAAEKVFHRLLVRLDLERPALRPGDLAKLMASVNIQRLQNTPIPLASTDIEALYRQILAPGA